MADQGVTRKLAAIFYADVAGYSRLTGADEEGTHRLVSAYLDAITASIQSHNGTALHFAGDAILAEFPTVSDALICAVNIQTDLGDRNQGLPDDRKVQFRIGVNLGEVIVDRGEIFGNGVNVAARLENLSEPGGICVSAAVRDAVGTKLPLDYDDMGEQSVKNIAEPVRAFTVRRRPDVVMPQPSTRITGKAGWSTRRRIAIATAAVVLFVAVGVVIVWLAPWTDETETASQETATLRLSDKPSIAILPFTNMSNDANQEYFADGMTEDLITDLSKISGLFVIARNSVFTYKGKAVNVQKVAEDLRVRYVLEGSVRRAGNQVRINTQLIDATTGGHLWAERYDGNMDDIFALQDRINRKITAALALELTQDEAKNVVDRGTKVLAAHDAFLKGWDRYLQSSPDDLVAAAEYFKEAIALDPKYSRAHAALALTYWQTSQRFWEIHLAMGLNEPRMLVLKHLNMALKKPSAIALGLASSVYIMQRRYDDAVEAARRAIALAPNSAEAHRALAYSLVMSGQLGEAGEIAAKAWRFDPRSVGQHFFLLGLIAFSEGRMEQSVELFERARTHQKYGQSFLPPLIAAYMHIGRAKEGKALSEIYYEYFSTHEADLRNIMYFWPFKKKNVAVRLADGLLRAGVQGQPGSYYNLSDDNRLTGNEIAELFGKTRSKWKVHDIRQFGDYPMELTDSFRDGGVVIRRHVDYFGLPTMAYKKEWTGRYWINGDLLCMDFERVEVGGIGCRPVFRKAGAITERDGPFVLVGVLGFDELTLAQ